MLGVIVLVKFKIRSIVLIKTEFFGAGCQIAFQNVYCSAFIVFSMNAKSPTPRLDIHPQIITDSLQNLTVGMMLRFSSAVSYTLLGSSL